MKAASYSKNQLVDALGTLTNAADRAFSPNDNSSGYYKPESIPVPRPSFKLFAESYANIQQFPNSSVSNHIVLTPELTRLSQMAVGLRGRATFLVKTASGAQKITAPGIILSGGTEVAILTTESSGEITEIGHALLDAEFVKHQAKVTAEHRSADAINAGGIAPALIVASSLVARSAHGDLHKLAGADGTTNSFGTNFSSSGRQDITIGNQKIFVRSIIQPTSNVIFDASEHDQLPPGYDAFAASLSADELTIGMTLAATTSRNNGKVPDLIGNLSIMVGQ